MPLPLLLLAGAAVMALKGGSGSGSSPGGSSGSSSSTGNDPNDPFFKFDALFQKYGQANGVPWRWLKAICMNESSLGQDPRVVAGETSSDGKSWGIMQLTLETTGQFVSGATTDDLNDPDFSVNVASQLLEWLQRQFPTSDTRWQEWVIKAYNEGRGNAHQEMLGGPGYADEYWARFQRNYQTIVDRQGDSD